LEQSASGPVLSEYHVEAAIASCHATASRAEETDWGQIVGLYDMLFTLRPSPVVALNRAIAIGEHRGPEAGLAAIRAMDGTARLERYPFYAAALGEMELRCGRSTAAREHFRFALGLARNPAERRYLEQKIADCGAAEVRSAALRGCPMRNPDSRCGGDS
jgi:RNA polymerase sigma-70 factor (ECF subfamily)